MKTTLSWDKKIINQKEQKKSFIFFSICQWNKNLKQIHFCVGILNNSKGHEKLIFGTFATRAVPTAHRFTHPPRAPQQQILFPFGLPCPPWGSPQPSLRAWTCSPLRGRNNCSVRQRVKEPVVCLGRGTPTFPSECNDYLSILFNETASTSRTETNPWGSVWLRKGRGLHPLQQQGQNLAEALKSFQRPPAPHHPPWRPSSWKHPQQFQGKLPNTFRMTKSHAFQHSNYSAQGKGQEEHCLVQRLARTRLSTWWAWFCRLVHWLLGFH